MSGFEGRVAIVTGAGSGIGAATAVALAHEGVTVVAAGRHLSKVEQTASYVETAGGRCLPLAVDVSRTTDVQHMVEECIHQFGRADILVNNAGILIHGDVLTADDDEFDRVMATNARGVYSCTRAVAPHMVQAGWGRIINIAAVNGYRPAGGSTLYAASKAVVVNLTMSTAQTLGPHGITVNAIAPGPIQTPMTQATWSDPARFAELMKRTVVGRGAQPSEVAQGVLFLASPEAGFISGVVLPIDGGRSIV
jgi:NAD(P)-dependent dehydrogenase (short-subunit alcohol dehydrogenase family)